MPSVIFREGPCYIYRYLGRISQLGIHRLKHNPHAVLHRRFAVSIYNSTLCLAVRTATNRASHPLMSPPLRSAYQMMWTQGVHLSPYSARFIQTSESCYLTRNLLP